MAPTLPTGQSPGARDPALGRALQVQAAVSLENATGQAPLGGLTAAALSSVTPTLAAGEGQPVREAQPEPNQLLGRIVRGLSALVNQRGGVLTMRLEPPELGQLRVQMTIARGVVTAQFHPATAEAVAILDRSLASLRTALEGHGLSVERLTVQAAPTSAAHSAREQAADEQGQQQQRHHADAGEGRSRGRRDEEPGDLPRRSRNFEVPAETIPPGDQR